MIDEGKETMFKRSPDLSKKVEEGCSLRQYKTKIEAWWNKGEYSVT